MEKRLYVASSYAASLYAAFVLSPGALFALLRPPEPPTLTPILTLAAQTSCQVATVYFPSRKTEPNAASGRGQSVRKPPR